MTIVIGELVTSTESFEGYGKRGLVFSTLCNCTDNWLRYVKYAGNVRDRRHRWDDLRGKRCEMD